MKEKKLLKYAYKKEQKEESENPDIRDRAYIYWRILEINPVQKNDG